MHIFKPKNEVSQATVLVDIGSGSVGVAILAPKRENENLPVIVWSHREYVHLKTKELSKSALKDVHAAILTAFLELGSTGLQALAAFDSSISTTDIHVSVSAPWSHTATKRIYYKKETPFTIEEAFIEELISSAKETDEALLQKLSEFGLRIISKSLIEVRLNDYVVHAPLKKSATEVLLTIVSSAVSETILTTIEESSSKILPAADVAIFSFIDVLYKTLRHLKPYTAEICIIDITDEATEMGIVRDDTLCYATHIRWGTVTIARMLAQALSVPVAEAQALLRLSSSEIEGHYSKEQQALIAQVRSEYIEKLTAMLLDTGDALSIPTTIFVHTDLHTEQFCLDCIKQARAALTESEIHVLRASAELFGNESVEDSALSASAYFVQHDLSNEESVLTLEV